MYNHWWWALVLLALNGLCDVTDGILARAMPHRSERLREKGAFLDPAIDRINDAFLFTGLLLFAIERLLTSVTPDFTWYRIFFFLLIAAAIAHPISSYYRARIESLNMRYQEKKPLTRAGFHFGLAVVIIGMIVVPAAYRFGVYFPWSVTICVSLPTIFNLVRRLRHSLRLFDQIYPRKLV